MAAAETLMMVVVVVGWWWWWWRPCQRPRQSRRQQSGVSSSSTLLLFRCLRFVYKSTRPTFADARETHVRIYHVAVGDSKQIKAFAPKSTLSPNDAVQAYFSDNNNEALNILFSPIRFLAQTSFVQQHWIRVFIKRVYTEHQGHRRGTYRESLSFVSPHRGEVSVAAVNPATTTTTTTPPPHARTYGGGGVNGPVGAAGRRRGGGPPGSTTSSMPSSRTRARAGSLCSCV